MTFAELPHVVSPVVLTQVVVRVTLLFGSQCAMSVCLHYPIPVGHCQWVVPWFTEDKSKALLTYTPLKVRLW